MGLILGIDTATEVCSVALGQDGKSIAEISNTLTNSHASQLHLMVQNIFRETGLELNQIDAIAVSKGPGSYTGLRVGVSAAKGYAYALNKPIITVSSLESLCYKFIQEQGKKNGLYIPMLDARRMEVYTAVFDENLIEIEPIQAKIIDGNSFEDLLTNHTLHFFGNGAEKCKNFIPHPHAFFYDAIQSGAIGILPKAEELLNKKSFVDTAYFEPYYLKEFVGTTPKQRK